jgi:nucleoid-associated protein YgaU
MVSPKQKLLAAGVVLAIGMTAAMLFRRSGDLAPQLSAPRAASIVAPTTAPPLATASLDGHFSPQSPVPAAAAVLTTIAPSPVPPIAQVESGMAPKIDDPAQPAYRIHVVSDGDTLERLAERYLGDGARALELFDLNRDVVENPHVLGIGAELRIPLPTASSPD